VQDDTVFPNQSVHALVFNFVQSCEICNGLHLFMLAACVQLFVSFSVQVSLPNRNNSAHPSFHETVYIAVAS
jgi:hypothetical protein